MHIDFLVTNPNKALKSHMGLGIIIAKRDVISKIMPDDCMSYSLNLVRHYHYALRNETHNSVSISSANALLVSLENHFYDKSLIEHYYKNYQELFAMTYNNIHYEKLLSLDISSPCIVTILVENSNDLIKYLFDKNYVVYECKGPLYITRVYKYLSMGRVERRKTFVNLSN